MKEKQTKRRNLLLVFVLIASMLISCLVTIRRLEAEQRPVSLPVAQVAPTEQNALEAFKAERDETAANDMAALLQLTENENLDTKTREQAADQLQDMISRREQQLALEGALTGSGVAPCAAVVTAGSVTIVTEKTTLTEGETALLLAMAQTHTGVEPSGVRVITGGKTN